LFDSSFDCINNGHCHSFGCIVKSCHIITVPPHLSLVLAYRTHGAFSALISSTGEDRDQYNSGLLIDEYLAAVSKICTPLFYATNDNPSFFLG